MSAKTQCDLVIEYIDRHGSISSMVAYDKLGITRLAARIYDLEAAGWEFSRARRRGPNRRGQMTHFDEYRITRRPVSAPEIDHVTGQIGLPFSATRRIAPYDPTAPGIN